jgi:hypothetical protein
MNFSRIRKLAIIGVISPYLLLMAGSARGQSTHSFNSGMNCYGVWKLPDTGQTASYTTTVGEDHNYAPGAVQPSYTVLNPVGISSVTVDNVTGLMWITNPKTDAGFGTYNWEGALWACEAKSYAGYPDWRVPNVKELMSILDYGDGTSPRINSTAFPGTTSTAYWTSTTDILNGYYYKWYVHFDDGSIATTNYDNSITPVRCVRGGL